MQAKRNKLSSNRNLSVAERLGEVTVGEKFCSIYVNKVGEYILADAYDNKNIYAVMTEDIFNSLFDI